MAIQLYIKINRKMLPRVSFIRRPDSKNNLKKSKILGIIPDNLNDLLSNIQEDFTTEEQYQLISYWHNLQFIMNEPHGRADQLYRELVYLPQEWDIVQVWHDAKTHGIPFEPRLIMLDALKQRIEAVKTQIQLNQTEGTDK